jgi:helicase
MKTSLPSNHGLPSALLARPEFLFRHNGEPSLTDVQWEALNTGIGRGESLLVLAPTSTGKTQIGIWAFASWLFAHTPRRRAVYLVTHRSLANQKFEEFRRILHEPLDIGSSSRLVLATGDRQVDTNGVQVSEPLRATLLVATYEKYLGLLCGSGIPTDLHDTCLVADEIQILGDKVRGVNIEVLLTLVRQATPGQFIGLSAVLSKDDGHALADWLQLQLVRVSHREKHLHYECRTPSKRLSFRTENPRGDSRGATYAWCGSRASAPDSGDHDYWPWKTHCRLLHAKEGCIHWLSRLLRIARLPIGWCPSTKWPDRRHTGGRAIVRNYAPPRCVSLC